MMKDFQHKNLRGVSFQGKDLTGADFSGADLSSANFAKAILVGANFSHCKTGLATIQLLVVGLCLLALTLLAGEISGYVAAGLCSPPYDDFSLLISRLIAFFILLGFSATTIVWGGVSIGILSVILAALFAFMLAIPGGEQDVRLELIFQSIVIISAIAGIFLTAISLASAEILLGAVGVVIVSIVIVAGAVVGGFFTGLYDTPVQPHEWGLTLGLTSLLASGFIALGFYIGWRAVAGDKKYALVRSIAIAMSSFGGTSFRGANLTDADFSNTTLKNSDFRGANLSRTNWLNAKELSQARTGNTYLSQSKIRQLVVTKYGQDENFDYLDLHSLNLQNANLIDASLISTKLNEANLQGANLTRAKLVQTQFYKANLTNACLTGAVIENWGISSDTQFAQVQCDYIYMRLPTRDDPDPYRKPDNRDEVFQAGDFADFIAPIIKTLDLYQTQNVDLRSVAQKFKVLDLYHYEGIDPCAATIALKQLAEQHPEAALEVVALEGRGEDKIRVQAKVTDSADRSALSAAYFDTYRELASLPYTDLQALIAGMAEKDDRIHSLERMVTTAIESSKFYVETLYDLGDTMTEDRSINIHSNGTVSGVVVGNIQDVSGVVNLGTVSGDVRHAIEQLSSTSNAEASGLKELLTQLQGAIESEAALKPEDKAEALAQVKTLAEAGQKPEDPILQKAAKTAMKILKGTVAGLSDVTKLVKECNVLIPAITSLMTLV